MRYAFFLELRTYFHKVYSQSLITEKLRTSFVRRKSFTLIEKYKNNKKYKKFLILDKYKLRLL